MIRNLLMIVASVFISVINYILKVILKSLVKFERYKTISGMNKSIILKLFIAISLNMIALPFFINLNLQTDPNIYKAAQKLPEGKIYFFGGKYSDIS